MKKAIYFFIIPIFLFLWACSEDLNNSDNISDVEPIELRSELPPRIV